MSIISQNTWEKFTQAEKQKIRNLYVSSPTDAYKRYLEAHYGKENLQPQLTYEDVANSLFSNSNHWVNRTSGLSLSDNLDYIIDSDNPNNCTSSIQAEKIRAINMLLNVAKYLNGDWKPDWKPNTDGNITEKKYYITIFDGNIEIEYTTRFNNSIVYFKSAELVKQAIQILGEDTVRLALSTDW